jgi:hypothetical protein
LWTAARVQEVTLLILLAFFIIWWSLAVAPGCTGPPRLPKLIPAEEKGGR